MLISILLFFNLALAQSQSSPWFYRKVSSQFSKTPSKISEWIKLYPDLFEDYLDLKVTAVTIEKGQYTYRGTTTCPANDPRLKLDETFIRYICFVEDDEEICEEYTPVEMPDFDPCSEKLLDNKKK